MLILPAKQARNQAVNKSSTGFIRVTGFEFIFRELSEYFPNSRPVLKKFEARILLKKAIKSFYAGDEIKLFGGMSELSGFQKEVNTWIEYFKREQVDPALLGRCFKNQIDKDDKAFIERFPKYWEFREIWSLYEEMKENRFWDHYDYQNQVLQYFSKKENPAPVFFQTERIVLKGFTSLQPYQLRILELFLMRGIKVELQYIPLAKGTQDTIVNFMQNEESKFLDLKRGYPEELSIITTPAKTGSLGGFFTKLFSDDLTPMQELPEARPMIIPCLNKKAEITFCARRIKKIYQSAPAVEPCIALIVSNLAEVSTMVQKIFAEYEIPIYFRRGDSLLRESEMRIYLAPLAAKSDSFSRNIFLNLINSRIFRLAGNSAAKDVKKMLQQSRSYLSIVEWQERFGEFPEWLEFIAELKSLDKEDHLNTHINGIISFFEKWFLACDITATDGQLVKTRVYAMLQITLRGLFSRNFTEKISLQEVIAIFVEELGEQYLSASNFMHGVAILNPYEALGAHFDYLFFPGFNEGEFPPKFFRSGWIDQLDIGKLNELLAQMDTFPFVTEKQIREKDLDRGHFLKMFIDICSSGSQELYLLYSEFDREGNPLNASYIIQDADRLLEYCRVKEFEPVALSSISFNERGNDYAIKFRLKPEVCAGDNNSELSEILRHPTFLFALRENKAVANERYLKKFLGYLPSAAVKLKAFSASRIQGYIRCPYLYFCRRILKIENTERVPTMDWSPILEGKVYHSLLCKLVQKINSIKKSAPEKLAEFFSALEDRVKNEFCKLKKDALAATDLQPADFEFWQRSEDKITTRTMRLLLADKTRLINPFIQHRCEKAFSYLLKSEEGKELDITGVIDRLDEDSDSLTIIDYKRGGQADLNKQLKELDNDLMERIPALQLLLYALPLQGQKKDIYLQFASIKNASFTRAIKLRKEIFSTFLSEIFPWLDKIMAGIYTVTPEPCLNNCAYADLCRYRDMVKE
ncbi:PD-(D/E)XK nuclease family protein [Candidatus Riflebacteria bacterium]